MRAVYRRCRLIRTAKMVAALQAFGSLFSWLLLSFTTSCAILWIAFPMLYRSPDRMLQSEWACYCQLKTGTSKRDVYYFPAPASVPVSDTIDHLPDGICHVELWPMYDNATILYEPRLYQRHGSRDVPCDPSKAVHAYTAIAAIGLLLFLAITIMPRRWGRRET